MKIHEYQAKEVFNNFGVPVPEGYPAFTIDEAEEAAKKNWRPGCSQSTDPRWRKR